MPNIARMYDYWLGGRENFQADRTAADRLTKLMPEARHWARDNREFVYRAVRHLTEQGITQFLDIGTGMPSGPAIHDIASEINPAIKVVYTDYDPIVVSHGKALLTKFGQAVVVHADLRQPKELLGHPEIRGHLDFGQPIGVILTAVLHFVPDGDDPPGIIAAIREALAPGSYLVLGHVTADYVPASLTSGALAMFEAASARVWPRSAAEIRRLFHGFELVEPGLVPSYAWRPERDEPDGRARTMILGGVARKT